MIKKRIKKGSCVIVTQILYGSYGVKASDRILQDYAQYVGKVATVEASDVEKDGFSIKHTLKFKSFDEIVGGFFVEELEELEKPCEECPARFQCWTS